MNRYVALLRGINVGGKQKVGMSDLRALLGKLGHTDVATLLQSGNAVFTSASRDEAKLAAQIEEAITAEMGLTVRVLVRDQAYLQRVVDHNPLSDVANNGSRYLAVFVSEEPDLAKITSLVCGNEAVATGERVVYVWLPDSVRDSKLGAALTSKKLGVDIATARNWNTVTKLLALL